MRTMRWLVMLSCLLFMVLTGCSDSDEAVCGTSDDCPTDQLCSEGVCRSPSGAICNGDPDCPGGYQCVSNTCERPDVDAGTTNNPVNNTNPNGMPNNTVEDMGMPNNTNTDNVNPEIVAFTPVEGTTDVAVDSAITIEFSEAMRESSVSFLALPLKDGSNNDVATTVTYDAATFTATITPNEPLRQATPYTMVGTRNVFDEASNRLIEDSARFYTEFNEPAHHTELAATYAPVIYQSLRDNSAADQANGDIPTTIDFDGNTQAIDNTANARQANADVRARVHYSVIESESHYFIHYTLYYAWRHSSDDEVIPHDFTGIVVVVDKASGEVALVEGAALRREEISLGFAISGRGFDDVDGKVDAFETMDAADLVDGTRFPLFITPGTHEACSWTKDGSRFPVSVCRHNPQMFNGAGGIVMRPGATAGRFADATDTDADGTPDLTYELVPMLSTLWARRADIGPERFWESPSVYAPDGGRPASPEGVEGGLLLPTRLVAPRDDNNMPVDSFGRPPFQWFEEPGSDNNGQWILDPAFLLTVRYNITPTFSQAYCYNPFLAIDRLDATDAPNCATPQ